MDYSKRLLHKNTFVAMRLLCVLFLLSCEKPNVEPTKPQNPNSKPKASVDGYLQVSPEGQFIRDGKPYYGIGINYFDAFFRLMRNNNTSYTQGFEVLKKNNIPFIRFTLLGFWPNDLNNKYLNDKEGFYRKFDRFIADAEKYGIGLIPSFFWNSTAVCDVVGEHTNQWENPDSKTIALMKQCTDEIVKRYKDKKIIWAWEFSNEINIYVDPMGRTDDNHKWMYVNQVNVAEGTPAQRTLADSLSTDGLRLGLKAFSAIIRKYDPDRAILSGNGMSHQGIYRRYTTKKWSGSDSPAEYTLACDLHNPSYVGTITIHPYPHNENAGYFQNPNNTFDDIIRETMRSAKELRRPLFVGEFGVDTSFGANEATKFNEYLSAILAHKVQLAALWVFDYSLQNGSWNITDTNPRKYQLEAIGKANTEFQKNR